MLADKPTELSRIKLKTWTRQPVPMISEHSAHLTPLSVDFRTWLWRYTYLLLLISMLWHRQAIFKSKGDKLCSSAECRIWTRGPRRQIASRLNARWQTDWAIEDQAKNLNSTARPYDQRAFSPLDPTVSWLSHQALAIYIFVVVNFDALAQASDIQIKGDKLCSSAECRIWTRGPRHQIANRLNARWQTDWAIEDQAKNWNSTARPYDQRAFSPLDPTVSWLSHLALAIYIFVVVNFDALAKASDIQIERRQVVFLCWMQNLNPGPMCQFASRLNARWQTDWAIEDQAKNLNSTARPYDQRAFSPLDPTVSWFSHLALAIYIFVVVNFDALAQASDIQIERRQVVPLLNVGFEPGTPDTKSPGEWMLADKPAELPRIKLKTWTRQPVPMISEHSAHLAPLSVAYIHKYIHT